MKRGALPSEAVSITEASWKSNKKSLQGWHGGTVRSILHLQVPADHMEEVRLGCPTSHPVTARESSKGAPEAASFASMWEAREKLGSSHAGHLGSEPAEISLSLLSVKTRLSI